MLTSFNGKTVTYEQIANGGNIGNMLSDGFRTYTWEHGRQLKTLSMYGKTWTYTYDVNGMRAGRSTSGTAYSYVYNGSQLSYMTVDGNTLQFIYSATGAPLAVIYNDEYYYYLTNTQGDVVALLDTDLYPVVTYAYDAWGNLVDMDGSLDGTLGIHNPLRYRGYVYDEETGLYYLQSRYYNPEIGRFINADRYASTGQGISGYNMFVYCGNNPIMRFDVSGEFFNTICGAIIGGLIAGFTRDASKESFAEAFLRGSVTGAIAGAALDISIVTAGTGAAIGIALFGGAFAGALDYGWEKANNGEQATIGGYITNALIGGTLNVLFMGAGRVAGRAVGDSIKTVGQALWKNTVKSVTSRAGNFMVKKLGQEVLSNTLSASIQGGFAKIYSFALECIGVF